MDEDEVGPSGGSIDEVITLIELQQGLLTTVATGGPRIEEVDWIYKERRQRLRRALRAYDLADPFPWAGLWEWHGFWGTLGGYAPRRRHIEQLAAPVLDALRDRRDGIGITDWADGGIVSLTARLEGIKERVQAASSLDDHQDVGRRCRELLADLATEVFEPGMVPEGQSVPGPKDVKARLECFFESRFAGKSNEEMRRLALAAVALANAITHSSHADAVKAYACAQATILVVRVAEKLVQAEEPEDENPFSWLS